MRALPSSFVAVLAAAVSVASPAWASDREHGPHVHGVGQMNVAVEDKTVEIELTAPGMDIAGFEHAPKGEDDRRAVDKLKDAMGLFAFPAAAKCALEEAEVHSPLMGDGEGHDHAGHEKEHAQEKEHAHEKDHDHERGEHSEFRAHYHFLCADPGMLSHIDVGGYFRAFSSARELEAKTITSKGQGAAELTAGNARLTF